MLEKIKKYLAFSLFAFLLVMPASPNFKLKDYGFGTGGTGSSSSGSYKLDAISGELSGDKMSAGGVGLGSGLFFTNQANVPKAPAFFNPGNYYNKLQIILDSSGNPTDTKFAIAISADNFVTTQYVKNDNTIGSTLTLADYQTYTAWGGASGFYAIGLASGTTYTIKVKAMQGNFSETDYGPTASATTANPTLSFSISPNTINFGVMATNTVNTSPQNITATLDTNAASGASIFIYASNGGLNSSVVGYKINAMTADLSVQSEGMGAQYVSVGQTSGGPLTVSAPYSNVSGDNVGVLDQTIRGIFDSSAPITGGNGVLRLKAKPSSTAPSANDYTETLTVTAAGKF